MAKKIKGFFPLPKDIQIRHVPERKLTREDLEQLISSMTRQKIDLAHLDLIQQRAHLSPADRLKINLRAMLSVAGDSNVVLTPSEFKALAECQTRGLSVEELSTAHGLFNMSERWAAMELYTKLATTIRMRGDSFLLRGEE